MRHLTCTICNTSFTSPIARGTVPQMCGAACRRRHAADRSRARYHRIAAEQLAYRQAAAAASLRALALTAAA